MFFFFFYCQQLSIALYQDKLYANYVEELPIVSIQRHYEHNIYTVD